MSAAGRTIYRLTILSGLLLFGGLILLPDAGYSFQISETNSRETGSKLAKAEVPGVLKMVTLHMNDVSLEKALNMLAREGQIGLSYRPSIIPDRKISLELDNVPFFDALYRLLENTNLKAVLSSGEDVVIIQKKADPHSGIIQEPVSGTVVDSESGEVLPGVNILVKGTTNGTSTDSDGNFSLNVPSPQEDTLVVSFIGYQTTEIAVNGRSKIDIEMVPEAIMGEEMVVVGYGEQRKEDLTGSIKSISSRDLPSTSSGNLSEALRGRAAGLNITGGGSTAGDEADLQVRAQNTLSAGSNPLIVLDGIIFHGSINDINMDDVERIDVLKDASAAAIYGSQSANGVIIITSREGSQGEPTINFSSYAGIQDHTNNPVTYMDGQQYAERLVNFNYISELYRWYDTDPTGPEDNGGRPEYPDVSDPEVISGYLKSQEEVENYLEGNEVNWMDEVTRVGAIQNYNLSVSGGTENINYYVSGSHRAEEGILKNDMFERFTLNTKINTDINDWITLGVNSSYSNRDYSGIAASLSSAQNTTPLAKVANDDGSYPLSYNSEFLMAHPLRNTLIDNKDIRKYFSISPRAEIDIFPIEGLTYEFNYSYNLNTRNNKTSRPTTIYEQSQNGGEVENSNSSSTNYLMNNILHYDREFADVHGVKLTLLYSREQREGESSSLYAERFENQSLGYYDPSFGMISNVSGGGFEETSLAYMARVNYDYNDKYLFTGTIRRDGYSGFGSNNKYATFRSLSLAWLASSEDFLSNKDWLDVFKLRVSYGENGNQGVGRYASLQRLSTRGYVYGSSRSVGLFPNTLGNSDLSWETTESFNIGLDYGFINNRISGSIDVYTSQTKDVLVQRALPGATGYQSVWTNIGAIDNKGIDIDLTTRNLTGSLQWESGFIFSLNRDEISRLYGDGRDDLGNSWFLGEPISAIYDYKHAGGLWTEEDLYNGEIPEGFYPGQYKLEDLNDDGRITLGEDRTIVGYSKPNYRFSISNLFQYKSISLSFLITSIQGGSGYYIQDNKRFLEATSDFDYAQRANQPAIRENWTPFNGVNDTPPIYNYPPAESGNYQSRSFVRLQNVSLGYELNAEMLSTIGIRSLRLNLNGRNLYTWTNWSGYDPELATQTTYMMRSVTAGIDIGL